MRNDLPVTGLVFYKPTESGVLWNNSSLQCCAGDANQAAEIGRGPQRGGRVAGSSQPDRVRGAERGGGDLGLPAPPGRPRKPGAARGRAAATTLRLFLW